MLPCCALAAFCIVQALAWLRALRLRLRRVLRLLALALAIELGLVAGIAVAGWIIEGARPNVLIAPWTALCRSVHVALE